MPLMELTTNQENNKNNPKNTTLITITFIIIILQDHNIECIFIIPRAMG